jgi:WD40 repeat protein
VAVGDITGRITLWYCLGIENKQQVITSSLHWHAHQVNALKYTHDGVYLLSGGQEGVLVLWQVATRTRQFLPHLGSDILSISLSQDQLFYSLALKDNSILIVSAVNLTIKQSISGLKHANADKSAYPFSTGLVVEPRSKAIALNGYPGTVQFYNYKTDSHIKEVIFFQLN